MELYNSVMLDQDLCKGCTNCIKRCPTQAIRVRNGKANIIKSLCIDCGECIRVCPHHAKIPRYDKLDTIHNFEYKVALPAPSFYAQFKNLDDVNIILRALKLMGFDDVFEVSAAAELVSEMTRDYIVKNYERKPFISTACPSVERLIRIRFPNLIDQLIPISAPFEVAASLAREEAIKKTGLSSEKIGIFFISPCPAKHTAVHELSEDGKSNIDGVLAVKDVYKEILPFMKQTAYDEEELIMSGKIGIGWGASGGESGGILSDSYLAADGIENVIRVLDDFEDQKFGELDFIELNACNGGCVGGVLQVENPYVARAKLKHLRKYMPVSNNHLAGRNLNSGSFEKDIEALPAYTLGSNFKESLELMGRVEDILSELPGLDCGTCGAPTCKALAEDIVRGEASEKDCIYRLRDYLHKISTDLKSL